MRDNGDDGVLEVRRGTIVKQVMPYIATVRLGGLTKHMVLYRSSTQVWYSPLIFTYS